MSGVTILAPNTADPAEWAARIRAAWQSSVQSIIETGRLLVAAKEGPDALPHGEFLGMVTTDLPFGASTAQRLMTVARDHRLSNAAHVQHLPPSWGTLYDLTKLDDDDFDRALRDGIINPDMQRKHVLALKRIANTPTAHQSGSTIADLHQAIAAGAQYGCIYADPPWLYDNQGTRAATGNHYEGLTVAELCALPIRELAADSAHLHLWTTNGFLFECPKIFEAWGFEFRSSFVWVKTEIGIGNYWRNAHEFLLTAIRGDAKRFNDKTLRSWIECSRSAHSAKPEQVRHMLERASRGPRLELFAREEVSGWDAWGNQVSPHLLSMREVA